MLVRSLSPVVLPSNFLSSSLLLARDARSRGMGLVADSSEWVPGEADKWNCDPFSVCIRAVSLTTGERSREVREWAYEHLLEHINQKGKGSRE